LSVGLYLHKNYQKAWLLAIATGMFTHLMLDSMWGAPQTLLWPLYGWAFPVPDRELPCAKSTGRLERLDAPPNIRRFILAAETAGCSRFEIKSV